MKEVTEEHEVASTKEEARGSKRKQGEARGSKRKTEDLAAAAAAAAAASHHAHKESSTFKRDDVRLFLFKFRSTTVSNVLCTFYL